MSPEILTYLSNKHKHKHSYTYYISNDDNSSYETSSIEKKSFKRYHLEPQIKEYLSNTLTKLLLSIIFLLLSIILIKSNSHIKEFYTEEVLTKQLNFTKFNNLYNKYLGNIPVNFYGQYYKSELTKKIALSIACTVLTLITLPLSNVRVKHGKLTGFAVAIVVAVAYWYMLFGAQLMIFNISSSPYLLILAPDIIIAIVAFILLFIYRKAR